jgi:hypothetical protein
MILVSLKLEMTAIRDIKGHVAYKRVHFILFCEEVGM